MSIGRNIVTIRILKGLKQEALAIILGLNQNAISTIEIKDKLDENLLIKIADALEVPVFFIKNFDKPKMFKVINSLKKRDFHNSEHEEDIAITLEAKIIELYKRLLSCKRERIKKIGYEYRPKD